MTPTGTNRRGPARGDGRARLLLFATARTAVGARTLSWPVPAEGATVGEVLAGLARAHPSVAPILPHCRYFLDNEAVGVNARVRPNSELAIHPPYGGG